MKAKVLAMQFVESCLQLLQRITSMDWFRQQRTGQTTRSPTSTKKIKVTKALMHASVMLLDKAKRRVEVSER